VKTTIILVLTFVLAPLVTYADGGTVHLREASGPFLVTVFAAPAAPRAGLIDMSVLVQDRKTDIVILDTTVNLELQPIPDSNPPFPIRATLGQAKNKLLKTVTIDVPAPGWWAVKIFVRRDREEVLLATKFLIMPAAPRLATLWPFLILPPLAIGLFALHQTLRHSRLPDSRRVMPDSPRNCSTQSAPLR
jgi:hypothetical protein